MKKTFILSVILSLSLAFSAYGQDYDLNLVTTSSGPYQVGSVYKVMVQIRATSGFNAGAFSLGLGFNESALSILKTASNPNILHPSSFTWQGPFVVHFPIQFANTAGVNANILGWGQQGLLSQIPAVALPVGATWVDMIEFNFTILSVDEALDFNTLGRGYSVGPTPQVFYEIDVTSTPVNILQNDGFSSVVFDGTNWIGGNGSSGEPVVSDGCKEIVVQSGTAHLTGTVDCDYITIASGAQLVVDPLSTLRPFLQDASSKYIVPVSTAFLIDADATGYGQYIGPGLPGTIKQWVGTDIGWRNMAFPVSSGTAFSVGGHPGGFNSSSTSYGTTTCDGAWGNYINSVNIYQFNTGSQDHEWYGAGSAPTGGTEGYNIFTGAPFGTNGIATIKGTFLDPSNVGTYSYSHTAPHSTASGSQSAVTNAAGCITEPVVDRQANWDGWALVANPFPCNLNVATFASDNGIATNQIRIWDRSNSQYVESDHATFGFATIAPMQAFWVKIGTGGHIQNLVFNDVQRVFDVATFLKYQGNQITLIASNTANQETSKIHLQFNANASKGYDQLYDSYTYNQSGSTTPQLSFHNTYVANGQTVVSPLDYNTVQDVVASDSYNLRFWSRSAGQFVFNVDTATMLPNWNVYIEDKKLAPNVYENITHTGFTFNYDPLVDDPERFVMYFTPSGSLDFKDDDVISSSNNVYAYSDIKGIKVAFKEYSSSTATIMIYTISGQLLIEDKNVRTDEVYLYKNENLAKAIYLVTVIGKDGSQDVFKIFK